MRGGNFMRSDSLGEVILPCSDGRKTKHNHNNTINAAHNEDQLDCFLPLY